MLDGWLFSLDIDDRELARRQALCNQIEHARARAFRFEKHRRRYLACHGRVREILAGYVGRAPSALVFAERGNGKPTLEGLPVPLYFNLSHSGDIAVVAVSDVGEVGVDVEIPRQVERAVAEQYFSARELSELGRFPPADWLDGFYRCWTRKEAFIKATGEGLARSLAGFSVSLADSGGPLPITLLDDDGVGETVSGLCLLPFSASGGGMGAVCARNCPAQHKVRWREQS
ncbi:MAG: 4'-phosphopantetheinyl transferase family protein [Hyphomicrobiaceae bacterium]